MVNQSRKLNEDLRIGKVTMHQVDFILHELQPSAKYKFYSTTAYDKVLSSHILTASDYYYYAVSNGERAIIIGSVSSTGDKIVCGMGFIANKRQYKIYIYHVEGGYISDGKFEDFVDQFFYDISLPVSLQQVQESFFLYQFKKKSHVTSSSSADVNVVNNINNDEDNDDGESDNGTNGPPIKQLRRTPSKKSAAIDSKSIQSSNKKNKGSDNSKNNPVPKNGRNTTVLDNKEAKKLEKMKNDLKKKTDELNQQKTIIKKVNDEVVKAQREANNFKLQSENLVRVNNQLESNITALKTKSSKQVTSSCSSEIISLTHKIDSLSKNVLGTTTSNTTYKEEEYKLLITQAVLEERVKGKDALIAEKSDRHTDAIVQSDKIVNLFSQTIKSNGTAPSYIYPSTSYPSASYPTHHFANNVSVCKYFKSNNGCRYGNSCRFDHRN